MSAWKKTQPTGLAKKSGTIVAEVMRNDDPLRSGRLLVYNADFGADPNNPDNWILAEYMSPFYGIQPLQYTSQEPNLNQNYPVRESYGWWMTPPDVGVRVVITFLNDDRSNAVWIGCLPEIGSHGAVPAQDKGDFDISEGETQRQFSQNPDGVERPDHSTRPQYNNQGIANDPLRGTITSSSLRESPSRVFGFNTPGSHSFVMDDGDASGTNKLLRLRSGAGNQIMMNDDSGLIYIINRDGTGWIELSPTGQIDVYGSSGINLATNGDINMHADRNIKMHAGNSVQIVGNNSAKVQGSQEIQLTGNVLKATGLQGVDIYSDSAVAVKAGGDFAVNAANVVFRGGCFKWNSGSGKQARCAPLENTGNRSGYQTTVNRAPSKEPYNEHDNGSGSVDSLTGSNSTSGSLAGTTGDTVGGIFSSQNRNTLNNFIQASSNLEPNMSQQEIEQDLERYAKEYRAMGIRLFYLSYGPAILEALALFLGGPEARRIVSFLNDVHEGVIESAETFTENSNPTTETPKTSVQAVVSTSGSVPTDFVKKAKSAKIATENILSRLDKTLENPLTSVLGDTAESVEDFFNTVTESPVIETATTAANAALGTVLPGFGAVSDITGQAFSALQDIGNSRVGNSLVSNSGSVTSGGISRGCSSARSSGSVNSGTSRTPAQIGNSSVDGLVDLTSIAELESDPAWAAKISEMERKYPGLTRDQIYRVIQGESGFNLKAKNELGTATGFFQFIESTANSLGYTTGEIQQMNAVQQLEVYDRYLSSNNYSGGPLGIMQAAPSFANASGNTIVYAKGTKAWRDNPVWRDKRTGEITVDSINAYYGY